ncbi:MAG: hypothetical protein ACRES9_07605 [Gammaproteobacteria bacterium]
MNMQSFKVSRFLGLAVVGAALVCVMTGAFAAGDANHDEDMRAVNNFRLNDKMIAEYTAVLKNFVVLRKQHPEVAKQMDEDSESANNKTFAQIAVSVNKFPLVRDAITRSGMSVTDYILCSFAVLQAGMRAMAVSEGASTSTVPSGIPTDNLHYYQANEARFDAVSKLMQQMNSNSDQ